MNPEGHKETEKEVVHFEDILQEYEQKQEKKNKDGDEVVLELQCDIYCFTFLKF